MPVFKSVYEIELLEKLHPKSKETFKELDNTHKRIFDSYSKYMDLYGKEHSLQKKGFDEDKKRFDLITKTKKSLIDDLKTENRLIKESYQYKKYMSDIDVKGLNIMRQRNREYRMQMGGAGMGTYAAHYGSKLGGLISSEKHPLGSAALSFSGGALSAAFMFSLSRLALASQRGASFEQQQMLLRGMSSTNARFPMTGYKTPGVWNPYGEAVPGFPKGFAGPGGPLARLGYTTEDLQAARIAGTAGLGLRGPLDPTKAYRMLTRGRAYPGLGPEQQAGAFDMMWRGGIIGKTGGRPIDEEAERRLIKIMHEGTKSGLAAHKIGEYLKHIEQLSDQQLKVAAQPIDQGEIATMMTALMKGVGGIFARPGVAAQTMGGLQAWMNRPGGAQETGFMMQALGLGQAGMSYADVVKRMQGPMDARKMKDVLSFYNKMAGGNAELAGVMFAGPGSPLEGLGITAEKFEKLIGALNKSDGAFEREYLTYKEMSDKEVDDFKSKTKAQATAVMEGAEYLKTNADVTERSIKLSREFATEINAITNALSEFSDTLLGGMGIIVKAIEFLGGDIDYGEQRVGRKSRKEAIGNLEKKGKWNYPIEGWTSLFLGIPDVDASDFVLLKTNRSSKMTEKEIQEEMERLKRQEDSHVVPKDFYKIRPKAINDAKLAESVNLFVDALSKLQTNRMILNVKVVDDATKPVAPSVSSGDTGEAVYAPGER